MKEVLASLVTKVTSFNNEKIFRMPRLLIAILLFAIHIGDFAEIRDDHYKPQSVINEDAQSNAFIEKKSQSHCCKICRKGKPCGNSCINQNYTCHKLPGCSCSNTKK